MKTIENVFKQISEINSFLHFKITQIMILLKALSHCAANVSDTGMRTAFAR